MDGKLTNDYNGNTNTGKGIKFGKNAYGSFFTFRPYLPDNILQVTKNDSTSLFSIDTFGNGSLGNNQIITSGNIGKQSVNYANKAGSANSAAIANKTTARYNGNHSPICPSLSDSQVQFLWNTSVKRVDVYVDKTYIGHIVTN